MDGWKLMSNELPPLDVPVWLWDGTRMLVGGRGLVVGEDGWLWWRARFVPWYDSGKWLPDDAENDDLAPTHWMELPMPPNAGNQQAP